MKSRNIKVIRTTSLYCRGIKVITVAQIHSTKSKLRSCTGSSPADGVSEICDGETLWQWSLLEIRLNVFRHSTIPQKQFIMTMCPLYLIAIVAFQPLYWIGLPFSLGYSLCSMIIIVWGSSWNSSLLKWHVISRTVPEINNSVWFL